MDRRWILGGVLFAGGVGLVRVLTARPKLDENSRVLLVGDSLAKGMAPHFVGLAEESDTPLLSMTLEGTRIDQWLGSNNLRGALTDFAPTHVLISLGTNDAYTAFDPADVTEDAATLVQMVKDAGANTIWIGAPDLPEASGGRPLNEDILDGIESQARYYFDSTTLTIPRGPDNLHPTAAGYAGWAGAIWNWLT